MKIRFRKQVVGTYGEANENDVKDVANGLARELIVNGIAEAVGDIDADDGDEDAGDSVGHQTIADVEQVGEPGEAHGEDNAQARRAARRRRVD